VTSMALRVWRRRRCVNASEGRVRCVVSGVVCVGRPGNFLLLIFPCCGDEWGLLTFLMAWDGGGCDVVAQVIVTLIR